MLHETVNRVAVLETGELFLGLASHRNSSYQYVYREAAGVYWDAERAGFKSTPMEKWSSQIWFKHIVSVVNSGLGVSLTLGELVAWENIPENEITEIKKENAF